MPKLRSFKRRFHLRSSSLLAICAVISIAGCDKAPKEPSIQDSSELTKVDKDFYNTTIPVGNFTLKWIGSESNELQLVISHKQHKQNWSSIPGKAFIEAAKASFEAPEFAGSFLIQEEVTKLCKEQSLNSLIKEANKLIVKGELGCSSESFNPESLEYELTFSALSENRLGISLVLPSLQTGRSSLIFLSKNQEHFFGMGEQFSHFDFKGKRVPVLVSEQGLARGREPLTSLLNIFAKGAGGYWFNSYAPIPHFISSELRSLALENSELSFFDFRDARKLEVQVYSPELKAQLFFSDTPLGLVSEYTALSGKMRALPDWINQGAILGLQGGTQKVEEVIEKIIAANGKLAAVWIQDWEGQRETLLGKRLWWNWELDEKQYPRFEELKGALAKNDIRLMAYINPFLVDADHKGKYKRNLYKEAKDNNYLLYNKKNEAVFISQGSFKAYMLDVSKAQARDWYKEIIKTEILDLGFSGWMADFGEAMPFEAAPHSGKAESLHNMYPVEWAKINREAIEEHGETSAKETVFFMRSAFTQSPAHSTLFWLGDQATNWDNYDGIKTSVTGLLSSGLSGFSFNHGDVGGYFSAKLPFVPHRSEELLMRWIELGAFQSVFRTHEGLLPEQNMQVYDNQKLINHFSRFTRIYQAWGFYREQLIQEASEKGWPVLRHPFLHYPSEEKFWALSYQQFLLGSELWFAPAIEPNQQTVEILLPKGEWVHAFTGQEYQSKGTENALTISSPLGTPAILYKKGSSVGEQFRHNMQQMELI
jgi:alpha-glucosidase